MDLIESFENKYLFIKMMHLLIRNQLKGTTAFDDKEMLIHLDYLFNKHKEDSNEEAN